MALENKMEDLVIDCYKNFHMEYHCIFLRQVSSSHIPLRIASHTEWRWKSRKPVLWFHLDIYFFLLQMSSVSSLMLQLHGWHEWERPSQSCSIWHNWKTVPVSCNKKCDLEKTTGVNSGTLYCAQGKNFVRPLGCFFQPRDPGCSAKKVSPNMGEFTHLKISCCSGAEVWRWAQKAGFSITLPNECIQAGRVQPGVPQCMLFVFIWTLALGAVAADLYLPTDWVKIKELHLQCAVRGSPVWQTQQVHLSVLRARTDWEHCSDPQLAALSTAPLPSVFTSWIGPVPLLKTWIPSHSSLRNQAGIYCNTGSCTMEVPLLVNMSW